MKKTVVVGIGVFFALFNASVVYAADVIISGPSARVALTAQYLEGRGIAVERKTTSEEVIGTFRGKSWPGVNVTSDGTPGSGIFVPVSDEALKNGLCADQRRLLDTFVIPAPATSQCGTCDERPFSGQVPDAVLAATNGQSADALEVHRRAGKTLPYKVKRLHIGTDGVARPAVWPSGKCMRIYASESITEAQMRALLHSGETIQSIAGGSDVGVTIPGAHFTEGVFLIVK